ncbi:MULTISPECIES: hypothetical protein [Hyphobacterium]|uniref:Uncharacterized protein n=1 Tax=Hyphobacterium vulgare TaxID=1736751 RepID=A0ABV6ZXI4_9PROT
MKTLLIGTSAAIVMSAAASAQLGEVTGQVQGQVDGTLDPQLQDTMDLDADLGADADARVDTRSGLRVDTALVNDLDSRLRAHDRTSAEARLSAELAANASAYVPAAHGPSVSGRSSYSGRSMTQSRMGNDHAEIRVYSRDGYHIGHVDRFSASSDGAIWVDPVEVSASERFALDPDDAAFDSAANAVVADMTRAQFNAAATTG